MVVSNRSEAFTGLISTSSMPIERASFSTSSRP